MAWPKLAREMVGRKVRTKKRIRNGYGSMEAGRILTVDRMSPGRMNLRAEHCESCGVAYFVTVRFGKWAKAERLLSHELELLPEDDP